jgi:hypothetical protein
MLFWEISSWVLFGLTIGGMFAFFMEKRGHTYEHLAAGVGGALVGGVIGLFLAAWIPAIDFHARDYSLTALIFSLIFSAAAIGIERKTHRRGRYIFRDARPDVP